MSGRPILLGALLLLPAALASGTERVQVDYMLNCQGCHLPDGTGMELRGVPSLRDHMARFLSVDGGREFLIRVPGAAMSDLEDARLAAVVNWMLRTFDPETLPQDFVPYGAEEVAALRSDPLIDVKGERARLMRRIGESGTD
jgi:hypothetical protein